MITARWAYYVVPILCGAGGALLGAIATQRRKTLPYAAALCGALAIIGAAAELLWHESPRIDIIERPRVLVAMSLAALIPTVVGFLSSLLAGREPSSRLQRVLVPVVAVAVAVAASPAYALLLLCYVGHDCI